MVCDKEGTLKIKIKGYQCSPLSHLHCLVQMTCKLEVDHNLPHVSPIEISIVASIKTMVMNYAIKLVTG